jgi:hypothetical protein
MFNVVVSGQFNRDPKLVVLDIVISTVLGPDSAGSSAIVESSSFNFEFVIILQRVD